MTSYNYVDSRNNNLTCCICRTPFVDPTTTRTCSHTFCFECISRALGHSPQCPVDRSPLTVSDLLPSDPIIRSLVDELLVECVHGEEGCTHTCQRQLLAAHLETSCPYSHVPCPGCGEGVLRKDLSSHNHGNTEEDVSDTDTEDSTCPSCSAPLSPSHTLTCPLHPISCTHAQYGCPWAGPRSSLPDHIPACPYESIKNFFPLNNTRLSALTEENLILRSKVDTLQGTVQILKREMRAVRNALGPWYRPEGSYTLPPSEELPLGVQPSTASTSAQPSVFEAHTGAVDDFAAYFPSESEGTRRTTTVYDGGVPFPRLTAIAPINLSTSLEGSLHGLHESVVTLAASVDSQGRRNEIALTNEAMRVNEEVMSLRANVHGLRMQVHAIMMDRNAQVTGRMGEVMPPPPRFSITKL